MDRIDYEASGGSSRLFRLDTGDEFVVEVHRDSFTFLWSTPLLADTWLSRLSPLLPTRGGRVLVMSHGRPVKYRPARFAEALAANRDDVDFVRVRFSDRLVTWERSAADPERDLVGEAAVLARSFDAEYIQSCIYLTTTADIREQLGLLLSESAEYVRRFPTDTLRRDATVDQRFGLTDAGTVDPDDREPPLGAV